MKKIIKSLLIGVTLGFFGFLVIQYAIPLPDALLEKPASTTKIVDRHGTLLYELLAPHQGRSSPVSLKEIAPQVVNATLAAEDARFYENSGVDWRAIFRAVMQNAGEREIVSGASTITQQVVRNTLYEGSARTIAQKIKEAVYAMRITQKLDKDTILELYLNRVYYGNHNYGIQAAARGYFDKNARDLDLAEAAFLAGLPQAPSAYSPLEHFDIAKKRQERVLARMVEQNFIDEAEAAAARDEKLVVAEGIHHPIAAPHFVNYVRDLARAQVKDNLYDGLVIETTLDAALQSELEALVKRYAEKLVEYDATNAAVIVTDTQSGDILAMVGSVDFFNKAIDGEVNSVLALRQPGSTVKPFTYALAFEKGWNGATAILDEPVRFETAYGTPYIPKNFDFDYHGLVSVRQALANSYNIPAIKTLEFVGVPALLERMRLAGFSSLTKSSDYYGLALTLGDGEVRMIDLVQAYSAFPRGGEIVEPRALKRITQKDRTIVQEESARTKKIFDPQIAFLITDILSDNKARIDEFGLKNKLELDRPAAVKTGTTRNFKDAWTVGYTPDRIVGVWVGNNDGTPMKSVTGGLGASPLWNEVMKLTHRGREPRSFDIPAGVEKRSVCEDAHASCAGGFEWFVQEQAPVAQAEQKEPLRIVKPFDGDEFKLSSLVHDGSNELLLQAEALFTWTKLQWLVNDIEVGEENNFWWKPKPGRYVIRARAWDNEGKEYNSTPVSISIQ